MLLVAQRSKRPERSDAAETRGTKVLRSKITQRSDFAHLIAEPNESDLRGFFAKNSPAVPQSQEEADSREESSL